MPRPLRLLATTALALVLAAPAALAPAAALAAATDLPAVRLALREDGGEAVFTAAFDLPPDATLPAEVAVAIPREAVLFWVGELLGGPSSEDVRSQYRVEPRSDHILVVLTLKRSRVGQVEAVLPRALRVAGEERTLEAEWVSAGEVGDLQFGLQLPGEARLVTVTPGAVGMTGRDGSPMHVLRHGGAGPGQKVSAFVTYRVAEPAAAPAGTKAPGEPGTVLLVAIAVLVLALLFAVLIVSRKGPRRAEEHDDNGAPA